ncbi:kinesin-like protein KIF6 isoform X1 [Biomphalaria glabrata]|uniref:Kinesin-like protein n=1 Tax=Biomphalaria glabrata TaxID=6526 RepID=A0A9W2ZUB8_BIOGL|nr:kinesin-like protein KIF6 isoform X1 [Biomphalaria glabrata]
MVKQTIQIFARIKPTKSSKTGGYEIDEDEEGHSRLQVVVPKELASGFVNNKKENYKFRFSKVFDQKSTQDEIFNLVAKPVIDNVVQGYNGTIFAYGQTGSGKTFTITGGAEKYIDRGIIPRSLSYLFDIIEKHPEKIFTFHISYLEIYNDNGYDLLDPKHEATKLEDLPKVSLMEDADQNIHLKNLTVHQAGSEEDALNLLFIGDTNRMIAETPMNQASSRSHCIFTVHLTSKEEGSATICRSKLHLVDLAGSERVSKTGVNGTLLTEAKYINLSLHYLEQVIIALSEKNRQHVPYRNSMMTSVLRDSLGGNCMTTMIATCSLEHSNIDESISTCRFAQRVAMIKNDVTLNEELDPRLLIAKLKRENAELRDQLALATGEQISEELTLEDIERCEVAVKSFVQDPDPECGLSIGHDLRKIQKCFKILKRYINEKVSSMSNSQISSIQPLREESIPDISPYRDAETAKLKSLIEQRDHEINILVNMLKKERQRTADVTAREVTQNRHSTVSSNSHNEQETDYVEQKNKRRFSTGSEVGGQSQAVSENKMNRQKTFDIKSSPATQENDERLKTKILGDMSLGRQEAFDIFMRDYRDREKIESNKQILKQRYGEAKAMGEQLNKSKQKMNHLKNILAQYRTQNNLEVDGETDVERDIKIKMEQEKHVYKETFTTLRGMKTEIEHLQHFLEKSKVKLMKDFELWWAEQMNYSARQSQSRQSQVGFSHQKVMSAWKTPPITPPVPTPPRGPPTNRTFTRETYSSDSDRGSSSGQTPTSKPPAYPTVGNFTLTGDSKVDADIQAFVKARQAIIQKVNANQR